MGFQPEVQRQFLIKHKTQLVEWDFTQVSGVTCRMLTMRGNVKIVAWPATQSLGRRQPPSEWDGYGELMGT